jgi:hypothetical protein
MIRQMNCCVKCQEIKLEISCCVDFIFFIYVDCSKDLMVLMTFLFGALGELSEQSSLAYCVIVHTRHTPEQPPLPPRRVRRGARPDTTLL